VGRILSNGTRPLIGKKSKTFKAGRVCADDDCETKLSVYNSETFCNYHRLRKRPRLRGQYLTEEEERLMMPRCVSCHQVKAILKGRGIIIYGGANEFEFAGKRHISGIGGAGTLCEIG
jgi:hypothetical protein